MVSPFEFNEKINMRSLSRDFCSALVLGQRDTGTRKFLCPGTKGQRDVPFCGNARSNWLDRAGATAHLMVAESRASDMAEAWTIPRLNWLRRAAILTVAGHVDFSPTKVPTARRTNWLWPPAFCPPLNSQKGPALLYLDWFVAAWFLDVNLLGLP